MFGAIVRTLLGTACRIAPTFVAMYATSSLNTPIVPA
jgi:hypothetical protein